MEKKTYRWWVLPVLLFVILMLLTVLFWDVLCLRIAPKAVLSAALRTTVSQLETRFRDDPLRILFNILEPEGKYTADIVLGAESADYDLSIQVNGKNKQVFSEGYVKTGNTHLDVSFYLDPNFMAVSSDKLVDGLFYGITYDTFAEDVRKIPLLDFFVSDKKLRQWDTSVKDIQRKINQHKIVQPLPEISEDDFRAVMLGILAMPCEIETTTVSIGDSAVQCQAVTYRIHKNSGKALQALLPVSGDISFDITFYLEERSLIKINLNVVSSGQNECYEVLLGQNPLEDALSLRKTKNIDGLITCYEMRVETHRTEEVYSEKWSMLRSEAGKASENHEIQFVYQLDNGKTQLAIDNQKPFAFMLSEKENGIQLQSDDFSQILQILQWDTELLAVDGPLSGRISVVKGSQIRVPVYKNLDKWDLEDFWNLLSGVGSFLGISLQ